MLPPSWPVACSACQMASTTGSGVSELRRPLQGRIFGGRHRLGEIMADLCPPVALSCRSGQRKAVLGKLRRTAPHEAEQLRLLLRRRGTATSTSLDRRIAAMLCHARAPTTVAIEDIVAAICDGAGFARRWSGVSIMQVRCITSEDSCGSLHARSETGVVEQSAGELRGVWHEPFQWRATAHAGIPVL
jgi:hypothetical protein